MEERMKERKKTNDEDKQFKETGSSAANFSNLYARSVKYDGQGS